MGGGGRGGERWGWGGGGRGGSAADTRTSTSARSHFLSTRNTRKLPSFLRLFVTGPHSGEQVGHPLDTPVDGDLQHGQRDGKNSLHTYGVIVTGDRHGPIFTGQCDSDNMGNVTVRTVYIRMA